MAVDFGTAFAQGIAQGLGQAGMSYVDDMRRRRIQREEMDETFNNFKKESVYSARLKDLQQMNVTADQWKVQAGKTTEDIIHEQALASSKDMAPLDRPAYIRDFMKRNNGITKAAALAQGGYVLPDYSDFMNDPTLKDAIPQAYQTGSTEPDASMSEVYKYDPSQYQVIQRQQAQKLSVYQQKKEDNMNGINDMMVASTGSTVSDSVSNALWATIGSKSKLEGADLVNHQVQALQSWIQKGLVVDTGTELKFRNDVDSRELTDTQTGLPQDTSMAPTVAPMGTQQTPAASQQYIDPSMTTDPVKAQQMQEKEQKETAKKLDTDVKAMGTAIAKTKSLNVMNSIRDAESALRALSPDAKDWLFSVESLGGDTGRNLAAKLGDDNARAARDVVRKLAQVKNVVLKERAGTAVATSEMKRFLEELDQPGVSKDPKAILAGLDNLFRLNADNVTSQMTGYSPEAKAELAKREPDLAPFIPAEETNQTQSDMSSGAPRFTQNGKSVTMDEDILQKFLSATPEQQQAFLKANNLTML